MGTWLALASAVLYGIVDFVGGRLSRRVDGVALALPVQCAGFLSMLVLSAALGSSFGGTPDGASLAWGALSGVGSGVAIMFLYRGMGRGQISLIVPLAAVVGAALPVAAGIVLLGDRPSLPALLGIGLVLPAVWLVARNPAGSTGPRMQGIPDAMLSGLGIAVQYACIAQAAESAGLWPMVANRLASIVAVWGYARLAGVGLRQAGPHLFHAAWIGVVASASLALYLLATRASLMTIAVVLASLYPVVPVVLGIGILKERISPAQKLGLGISAAAVALIVTG